MGSTILEVEADGLLLAISAAPRHFAHAKGVPPTKLDVVGATAVRVGGVEIVERSALALYEDVEYTLRASSDDGVPPRLWARDPLLLARVEPFGPIVSGPVNFHRQVGQVELVVATGRARVSIRLDVRPTKVDYESDYEAMLLAARQMHEALVLEYLRATHRLGSAKQGANPSTVGWATLVRNRIADLGVALRLVQRQPQHALQRAVSEKRATHVKGSDREAIRAIGRGTGRGAWQTAASFGKIRTFLPARSSVASLDTPEHRWLSREVHALHHGLAVVARQVREQLGRSQARYGYSVRLAQELQELRDLHEQAGELLGLPVLQHGGAVPAGFSSLQLTTGIGYADATRILLELKQALTVDRGAVELSVVDVHDLYEMWCFLSVVRIIGSSLDAQPDLADLVTLSEAGWRVNLAKGHASAVRFRTQNATVRVLYNPIYSRPTGVHKPDIVVEVTGDEFNRVIVFDAKYRVDSSPAYVNQYGQPGPPADAINALHRYRDAIAANGQLELAEAVALFPLDARDADGFESAKLAQSIRSVRVGALPFLPSNMTFAEERIRELLSAALTPICASDSDVSL
ncbi:DUF2357 domain-containing protein [Curtobacterium sp. MCBD17_040]|uniref:DUF2357 domain-containing protein n=1 Tax=Curtobacterium sp. MCBD17_040 TaxID=2175674 RepID=UPI000DAA86B4|nr:DUF2357 domain-containing protein [Curtobacterium sp. MCBD17_040]WIB64041.1 DUF2357 domain-containing protein [Curtobacterium sp. MCBD17_040]